MCSPRSVDALIIAIVNGRLDVLALYIRSGVDINVRSYHNACEKDYPLRVSVRYNYPNIATMLLISVASHGVSSMFKNETKPRIEKLMMDWNVYDNNVTPLKQRCRCAILNHLYPRADLKIGKLPLPGSLIKYLNIPELDNLVHEHTKAYGR